MSDDGAVTADRRGQAVWPDERAALRVLLAVSLLLSLATLAGRIVDVSGADPGLLLRFDASAEGTVAVWFTAALLGAAGALAAGIGRARDDRTWVVIGLLLLAASVDEVGQLHEEIASWATDAGDALGQGRSVARVLAAAAAVAVVGAGLAALTPWARRLDPGLRRRLTAAAAIYFGGALACELVQRAIETSVASGAALDVAEILKVPEELLEMAGASLLVAALLSVAPAIGPAERGQPG